MFDTHFSVFYYLLMKLCNQSRGNVTVQAGPPLRVPCLNCNEETTMENKRAETTDERHLWNIDINDRSPHGICVMYVRLNEAGAPYDWCFDYCNPALARAEGTTPEELRGKSYFELHPGSSREWLPYYYRAAYEDTYQAFDIVSQRTGTYLRIEALPTGKTGYCMCVLYNIQQEIIEKEHQNRQLQEMYQQLANEKKVLDQLCTDYTAVYHVNVDTGAFDILHIAQDTNASRLMDRNYTNFDEFSDVYLDTYFYPEAREAFRAWLRVANLRKLLAEQPRVTNHYESMPTPSGHRFFEAQVVRTHDAEGRMYALIGFRCIDDIMERETAIQKKLKTALDEAQLRYEIISAIAKAYTTILRIDLVQDSAEKITDRGQAQAIVQLEKTASAALRKACDQRVAPEYREAAKKFMDLSNLSERMAHDDILDTEYKMVDGNWHRFCFLVKKRDETGCVTHVLATVRSISDVKRRELDLVYQADAAKREGEMKARFLSNMSHDIRTPLNGVIGLVNLACQYPENLEMLTKIRSKERETLQYLVSLVNDILDMNKLASGTIEERELDFDLVDLLVRLNQQAQTKAEKKGVQYQIDWHRGDIRHPALRGNPVYLTRILTNITDNAIKFSEPGTTVRVWGEEVTGATPASGNASATRVVTSQDSPAAGTTTPDTRQDTPVSGTTALVDAGASAADPAREVTGAAAETLASEAAPQKTVFRFYCEDQGCGMSEETLHRVGMAFAQGVETSRTQYQGAGLGLAITKQMVDRMGGQMKIESTLGVGTKLIIELPFAIGEQSAIHPEGQNFDETPVEGIRALVVEDNELNREIATFMLENHGIEVTPAVDGQEAVEIFENSAPGYFGAIYMDIMMPRMNGLDATRAIRAMKRRDARVIPIIAMSANAFSDDIINGRLAGMNRHLAKPVDEEGMIRALRECMSENDVLKLSEDL